MSNPSDLARLVRLVRLAEQDRTVAPTDALAQAVRLAALAGWEATR